MNSKYTQKCVCGPRLGRKRIFWCIWSLEPMKRVWWLQMSFFSLEGASSTPQTFSWIWGAISRWGKGGRKEGREGKRKEVEEWNKCPQINLVTPLMDDGDDDDDDVDFRCSNRLRWPAARWPRDRAPWRTPRSDRRLWQLVDVDQTSPRLQGPQVDRRPPDVSWPALRRPRRWRQRPRSWPTVADVFFTCVTDRLCCA